MKCSFSSLVRSIKWNSLMIAAAAVVAFALPLPATAQKRISQYNNNPFPATNALIILEDLTAPVVGPSNYNVSVQQLATNILVNYSNVPANLLGTFNGGGSIIGTPITTNIAGVQLQSPSKVIVIVGDSVGAGVNADSGKGWAALFTTMMTARGWTVYNECVSQSWVNDLFGGLVYPTTSTGHAMEDFYIHVLSHNPQVVIDCMNFNSTSPSSSPTGSPGVVASKANTNTWCLYQRAYLHLLQNYGIQPFFVKNEAWSSPAPYNYYNEESIRFSWADQLESEGIPCLDFQDALAEYRNNIPAVMSDGLHPNNLGHALMFSAISPTLFDSPWTFGQAYRAINQFRPKTALRVLAPTGTEIMVYTPSFAMSNFTYSAWIKDWGNPNPYGSAMAARGIFTWPSGGGSSVNSDSIEIDENKTVKGSYHAYAGASFSPTPIGVAGPDFTNDNWTHFAITYNAGAGNANYYINGALAWTFNGGDMVYTNVHFLLGASGGASVAQYTDYSEVAIYRTCLISNEVAKLANHQYPLAGMEVFCPFDDATFTAGVPLHNLSPTHEASFIPTASAVANMVKLSTASPDRLPVFPFAPYVNTSGGMLWISNQTPNLYYSTTNSSGVEITTLK